MMLPVVLKVVTVAAAGVALPMIMLLIVPALVGAISTAPVPVGLICT